MGGSAWPGEGWQGPGLWGVTASAPTEIAAAPTPVRIFRFLKYHKITSHGTVRSVLVPRAHCPRRLRRAPANRSVSVLSHLPSTALAGSAGDRGAAVPCFKPGTLGSHAPHWPCRTLYKSSSIGRDQSAHAQCFGSWLHHLGVWLCGPEAVTKLTAPGAEGGAAKDGVALAGFESTLPAGLVAFLTSSLPPALHRPVPASWTPYRLRRTPGLWPLALLFS